MCAQIKVFFALQTQVQVFSGFVGSGSEGPVQVRSLRENWGVGWECRIVEMKKPQPKMAGAWSSYMLLDLKIHVLFVA
jgi:hypothetical protein